MNQHGGSSHHDLDEALIELDDHRAEKTSLIQPGSSRNYQSTSTPIGHGPDFGPDDHHGSTFECTLESLKEHLISWNALKIFLILLCTLISVGVFLVVPEDDPEANRIAGFSNSYPLIRPVHGHMSDLFSLSLQLQELSQNVSVAVEATLYGAKEGSDDWTNVTSWQGTSSHDYPLEMKAYLFDIRELVPGFDIHQFHEYRFILSTDSEIPLAVDFRVHALPNATRYQVLIAALILVSLYVLIIFEWVHRTLAAMLCAFIALGAVSQLHTRPTFEEVIMHIDFETVGLLFGMMIMVGIFSQTGFFEWFGVKAYKYSKGNLWYLTCLLCLFTAIVSAFLDNVTTILLMTPVTVKICRALDTSPILMLLAEVIFSNIGGTATIIGDPPNIIIGNNPQIKKTVNFANFTGNIAPCIILCMIAIFFYLWKFYSHRLTRTPNLAIKTDIAIWKKTLSKFGTDDDEAEAAVKHSLETYIAQLEAEIGEDAHLSSVTELEQKYHIRDMGLLISSSVVLGVTILMFFMHSLLHVDITLAWIAIIGAMIHILVSGLHDLEEILEKVEFGTLIFFAGLFILMETLSEMGLINWIADRLIDVIATAPEGKSRLALAVFLILWVSGIASAFIDNIPYTATLVPVVVKLAVGLNIDLNTMVWALALGACLGGNGTLIGASANVVAVGLLEKEGWKVSFMEFFRFGAPITVITIVISTVYLLLFHVAIFG